MKISVVTISYNQGRFLQACLDSVRSQEGEWEHIIVDPGSQDSSRDVIENSRAQFSHVILSPDRGPADGLNIGFSRASGDILFYLNADDVVLPGAFSDARQLFRQYYSADVISGHGYILNEVGQFERKVWSDSVSRMGFAFGGSILIQQATFIRRTAFEKVGGFNIENQSNWDGELALDLFMAGAKFVTVEKYWGGYRIHKDSITGSARLDEKIRAWNQRQYERVLGKKYGWTRPVIGQLYRARRVLRRPEALLYRLERRRVYGGRVN